MKYWIDTEFLERPYTIDLISIGLVAEDGREFYAESSEVDWTKASQWTLQTVRPQLDKRACSMRVSFGAEVGRLSCLRSPRRSPGGPRRLSPGADPADAARRSP
jgi:3' exoribonuclease, RNase T-like